MFPDDPKLMAAIRAHHEPRLLRYAAECDAALAASRELHLASEEWRYWRNTGVERCHKSAVRHYVQYRKKRARLKLLLKRRGLDYDAVSIPLPFLERSSAKRRKPVRELSPA